MFGFPMIRVQNGWDLSYSYCYNQPFQNQTIGNQNFNTFSIPMCSVFKCSVFKPPRPTVVSCMAELQKLSDLQVQWGSKFGTFTISHSLEYKGIFLPDIQMVKVSKECFKRYFHMGICDKYIDRNKIIEVLAKLNLQHTY